MPKESLLHRAIKNNQLAEAIRLVKKAPSIALLEQCDELGLTPLQQASKRGMTELVLWLIAYGADVNNCLKSAADPIARFTCHKPAFYLAIEAGHFITAQVLLAIGAEGDESVAIAHRHDPSLILLLRSMTVNGAILQGLFIWLLTHQPEKASTLLLLLDSQANHDDDYWEIDNAEPRPSVSIMPSSPRASVAKGECFNWTALLNGLCALAKQNKRDDLLAPLTHMNRGNASLLEASMMLSAEQEQLYLRLKSMGKSVKHEGRYSLEDCLSVVDYFMASHDFRTLIPWVKVLGLDAVIQHALDTKNQPLLLTLMFSHDCFTHSLKAKIPHALNVSLAQLNTALLPLGEKSLIPSSLYTWLVATKAGPERIVYDYLDSTSQLQFFKVTKASQRLHAALPCWPNEANHFFRDVQSLLAKQSYFKARDSGCLTFSGCIAVPLIVMSIMTVFLVKFISEMNAVYSRMDETSYQGSVTERCNVFLHGPRFLISCLPKNATLWENCADLCDSLNDVNEQLIPTFSAGVGIPLLGLVAGVVGFWYKPEARDFSASIKRFDKARLSDFPFIALREQALATNLAENYGLDLSRNNAETLALFKTTSANELRFYFQEQKNSFFFKAPVMTNVNTSMVIEVFDEPTEFSTTPLVGSPQARG